MENCIGDKKERASGVRDKGRHASGLLVARGRFEQIGRMENGKEFLSWLLHGASLTKRRSEIRMRKKAAKRSKREKR